MMVHFAKLLLLILLSQSIYAQDSLNYYFGKALEAKGAEMNVEYLKAIRKTNNLRPYHPTIVYHLIQAYLANEQTDAAMEALRIFLRMNDSYEFDRDSTLLILRKHPEYNTLANFISELQKEIQTGTTYLDLQLDGLHPESIAENPSTGHLLLGGVHQKKIVSINQDGDITTFYTPDSDTPFFAALGMTYDPIQNMFWVCTAALPEMASYTEEDQGKSSLIKLSSSGELLWNSELAGGHVFGDVIVTDYGEVLISDGQANVIYVLNDNQEFVIKHDLSTMALNLQGLTQVNDTLIIVADYITGFYGIHSNGTIRAMPLPDNVLPKGFDGIYFHNNAVYAIQNGVRTKKVWKLKLNNDNSAFVEAVLLENGLEDLNEPTQGVIFRNKFIYLANSPWWNYDNGQVKGAFPKTILRAIDLE